MTNSIGKQIDEVIANLAQAGRSSNAEAVQKAYEELFAFCYDNHLDLTALLGSSRI